MCCMMEKVKSKIKIEYFITFPEDSLFRKWKYEPILLRSSVHKPVFACLLVIILLMI